MKKLLTALLALALCALSFGALAEADDVTGEWYLNSVEAGGISMNPAMLGFEITITLNADGTAAATAPEEEDAVGTWTRTGDTIAVEIDGDPMEFTLEEGMLVAFDEESETKMIFGRERAVAVAFQPAPVRTDAALEEFDGTWNATMIDMMGMQLPVAAMGLEMSFVIEGGKVAVMQGSGEELNAETAEGALVDGALVLTAEEDGAFESITLNLHEDGSMSYAPDESGTIYFERAIAE